jgi:hypothetical protein
MLIAMVCLLNIIKAQYLICQWTTIRNNCLSFYLTYHAYLIWKISQQILKEYFKFSFPDFVSLPGVGVYIWFVLLHDNIFLKNFYVSRRWSQWQNLGYLGVCFMCCFLKYIKKIFFYFLKFIFDTNTLE